MQKPLLENSPLLVKAPYLYILMVTFLAAVILTPLPALAAGELDRARRLIKSERPEEALNLLDQVIDREDGKSRRAEALLLRSTARIMLGDAIRGQQDLETALKLDSSQRQGWLNLGALHVAAGRNDKALDAFHKARDLDPSALDNDLNLGAVLLFQGKLEPAREHFQRYLGASDTSKAHYLVATNFALTGYASLAAQNLRWAIALEERARLRARTDPSFSAMLDQPAFQRLLLEDPYRPPPGAHRSRHSFKVPYDSRDARLLGAVLDALGDLKIPYNPQVEVTPGWALVWSDDLRIKIAEGDGRKGIVEVTAPADRLTATQYQQRMDTLMPAIARRLNARLNQSLNGRH